MRLDPFDFWFKEVADDWFGRIRLESGGMPADVSRFAELDATEAIFAELSPTPLLQTDPPLAEQYLSLLFAAYLYWDGGRLLIPVQREEIEPLLRDEPETPPPVPARAYVQLPEKMFWARVSETAPHEPIDGVVISELPDQRVFVLAILGFRTERNGVSQLKLIGSLEEWNTARSERAGQSFEPVMDGGKEAGFHSVTTETELMHLARLALRASHV